MSQRTHSMHGLSVRARSAALFLLFFALGLTPLHAAASGGGKASPKPRRVTPGQIGEWAAITPAPKATVVAIHTHVLPDGRILFWGANAAGTTSAQIWNPSTNALVSANYVGASLFCGGHSFLPDGRLLVTGGQTTLLAGIPNTTIFDYTTNTWTDTGNNMNLGRWYPSNVTLGNGEVLVAAGTHCTTFNANGECTNWINNPLPQVWQTGGGGGWRSLTNASLELVTYPWLYLRSNGKVFLAGPLRYTGHLDTAGTGQWEAPAPLSTVEWRESGSSVMYDVDKIMIVGGNNPVPEKSTEIIDFSISPLMWQPVGDMHYRRRHHNTTVLADGKVLVTGGTSGPDFDPCGAVHVAELWDPTTGQWTDMAAQSFPRLYHSTALLMPDGRVFSGGTTATNGVLCKMTVPNITELEAYSPPYLFNADGSPATRPTITYAPTDVTYGQVFPVGVAGITTISKVTLIRLPSVTHSFDQSQRLNYLEFRRTGTGLRVTAPANGNVCPPGYYMMFILNNASVPVPSVAKIIHVS